jgi:hypothetical protein
VFQTNSGIRNIVMPGARMQMTVVMKLTAPRMMPRPAIDGPMIHRSPPTPGERTSLERGYATHPTTRQSGVRNPDAVMRLPNR